MDYLLLMNQKWNPRIQNLRTKKETSADKEGEDDQASVEKSKQTMTSESEEEPCEERDSEKQPCEKTDSEQKPSEKKPCTNTDSEKQPCETDSEVQNDTLDESEPETASATVDQNCSSGDDVAAGKASCKISGNSKSVATHTTPTTTTSHLYTVLMAPLNDRTPYRGTALRSAHDKDLDESPKKRLKLDATDKTCVLTTGGGDAKKSQAAVNNNSDVGMDLTKNQKRKLKKKKRKHVLSKLEVQRAKDFIYSSQNEQYSVEKLRTMIEDVTEFLDAIWDVYCSEARVKGESVEEDGYRVAAVLKCLSASGEGSWGDLQLLSRAKSVLVLRSKNLAADTISQVESQLGYDADIRTFIVRMLKFWMQEVVTQG